MKEAERLLNKYIKDTISTADIERYNLNRFDDGNLLPGVDTNLLSWEDYGAGLFKKVFYVLDTSGEHYAVKRTAWYYADGGAEGADIPCLIIEDEQGAELTTIQEK